MRFLLNCFCIVLGCGIGALLLGAADAGTKSYVYKKVDGRDLSLTVYQPADAKAPHPAIVFFHGGGFVSGRPGSFAPQARYLASRGMVAITVQYRLLTKRDQTPAICIADAKSAMRWVRSRAAELNIDPSRIASAGGSAGGHLAASVTLLPGFDDPQDDLSVSPRSQAMILFNPVFNNGPGQWGYNRVGDKYKDYSPAHHVTADAPPAIIMIGEHDHLIPLQVVKDFQAEMQKAGVRCDLHVYGGQDHGFFNKGAQTGDGVYYLATLREIDAFLVSLGWLQGESPLPTTQPAEKK